MDNINRLNDMLTTEMHSQMIYNKYMIEIQNPEVRQMLLQLRDVKMQHITQLQLEIKKMMENS